MKWKSDFFFLDNLSWLLRVFGHWFCLINKKSMNDVFRKSNRSNKICWVFDFESLEHRFEIFLSEKQKFCVFCHDNWNKQVKSRIFYLRIPDSNKIVESQIESRFFFSLR